MDRPGLLPALVVALLAAVMADCHTCCAPAGVTVVGVALLAPGTPRRRLFRAGLAAAVGAAAAFAMAPLQWMENVRFALHRGGAGGGGHAHATLGLGAVASIVRGDSIAWCSFVGAVAWVALVIMRRKGLRRQLDVAMLVVAPMLAAFVLAARQGVGDSGGKYLAHIKPAAALAVAVLLVGAARWLASRSRVLGRLRTPATHILPWAAALAIGLSARDGFGYDPIRFPLFTLRDVGGFARVLMRERGWSRARLVRHLQTFDQPTMVTAILADDAVGESSGPPGDDATNAFVLELALEDLPDPLPPSWEVAHRTSRTAAVIVFARSRLDWQHGEMCTGNAAGERLCLPEVGVGLDGAATPRPARGSHLSLRVPVLPGPPGRLLMPRLPDVCGGRIVAATGADTRVDEGGREAALGPAGGVVELDWDLGTPACPDHFSFPHPPFFAEGEAEPIAALEAVLRRHEP